MPKKILVVDDERHIARLVQVNLERAGYEAITALDVRDGLQKAEWEQPDLILLDSLLPDRSRLLAELHRNPRTCGILIKELPYKVPEWDLFRPL